MLLLIDNYDSFAHNLARYLRRLGQEVRVDRNDAVDVASIRQLKPQAVILSPGPCTPREAGSSLDIVRELHTQLPMLGICLGHQTLAAALGAEIVRAAIPMHGRTSEITHDDSQLFEEIPSPLTVCRYHSLVIEPASLPAELTATAHAADGTIMAIQHRDLPLFGLQFHPEAILTQHGYRLLYNFLRAAGLTDAAFDAKITESEFPQRAPQDSNLPTRPVTF